jgi:amino acid transporter
MLPLRLNVAGKSLALLGAALLLLDFASTSVVSAATAAAYLSGEVRLPFPEFVAAALLLVAFTLVSLTGLKESARIAFVVLAFHVSPTSLRISADILIDRVD